MTEDNFESDYETYEAEVLIDKLGKGMAVKQKKLAAAQQAQLSQEAFTETFEELGLDQNEWQQALNADPAATTAEYKEGIKNYIRKVTKRVRDPKTGQFVKTQPNQTQGQVQQTQSRVPEPKTRVEKQTSLKEVHKNTSGSDDDIDAMLDVMLPDNDSFFNI